MAGIDYTIPGQFKGIQLESPMNVMAQAMQLRGLQDTLQLNALKAQEYQQQQQEKNALAQLMADTTIPYGSDAFFRKLATISPRSYESIASGVEKRQTAEAQQELARSTKQQREQAIEEAARKTKEARRGNAFRYIANAQDFKQAASLVERAVRNGDISREEADDMLAPLYASGQPDMGQFRANVLTGLLPAEKVFEEQRASEKQAQDRAKFESENLDRNLARFNAVYNPALISTTDKTVGAAQITQRLRALYKHPVLGKEAAAFMPEEEAIKQHIENYNQNAENYIATMMNMSGKDILEARQKAEERREKDIRTAYEEYEFEEALKNKIAMPYSEFKADYLKQGAAPAPAPEPAVVPAVALTAESTAAVAPRVVEAQSFGRNVPRPEVAPAIAPAAAPAPKTAVEDELPSLPPVEVNYGIAGVSPAVVSLLRGTPEGRRKLAELAQAEYSPANVAKRKLDSDRLQADITHRQHMEEIARRSENRQQDEAKERKRHSTVMEGIAKNQYFLQADKVNQVATTQVDDNGNVTLFNGRGQEIRRIPNVGKRSPSVIKAEQARAEGLRTIESLIPDVEEMIKKGGLIDQSTGSGVGRLADVGAEFFGYATEGSIASSRLEPIAAMITMTVPRFEGPQSEADRKFYERAAGDLANPRLPAEKRKAAGEIVLRFMKQRKGQFILKGSELDASGGGSVEPPAGFVRDK